MFAMAMVSITQHCTLIMIEVCPWSVCMRVHAEDQQSKHRPYNGLRRQPVSAAVQALSVCKPA